MPEEDYDIVRAKDDFPANLEFSLKKKKMLLVLGLGEEGHSLPYNLTYSIK